MKRLVLTMFIGLGWISGTALAQDACETWADEQAAAAATAQSAGLVIALAQIEHAAPPFGLIGETPLDMNYPFPVSCGLTDLKWSTNRDDRIQYCRNAGYSADFWMIEYLRTNMELAYCAICISVSNRLAKLQTQAKLKGCVLRANGRPLPSSVDGLMQVCEGLQKGGPANIFTLGWAYDLLNEESNQLKACLDRSLDRQLNSKFDPRSLKENKVSRRASGSVSGGAVPAQPGGSSSSSRALTPGLLEGDSGFSTSAPVAVRGGSVSSSKVNAATPSVSVQTAPATSSSGFTGSKVHVGVPPPAPGPNIR